MDKTNDTARLKDIKLPADVPTKQHKDADDEEFNKLLAEFFVEKAPMLKRISKK